MKRRKLKKRVVIIFSIILLLGAGIIITLTKPKTINNNVVKENINEEVINNILSYNIDGLDEDFLKYIVEKFGIDALVYVDKQMKDNNYSLETWYEATQNSYLVLQDNYHNVYENVDNVKVINNNSDNITLSFIGDISLADNYFVMPAYDERGKKALGIFSKDVLDIMQKSDILVANNEFTVSTRGTAMPGKAFTFRASPERLSIYAEMGVDLVTLANNHVYDFGSIAFNDMLSSLDEYKIPHIGAGKNITEAAKPYYFILNGRKIAFVNATRAEKNIMTPGATSDSEGVLRCYDPTYFINTIKEAKENSDYVIALVHFGKEASHSLEDVQVETSKMYIDAGADVIVGTHAHVLQGMEMYKDKLIAYNLGDFLFNNKTNDTGIFQVNIDKKGNLTYRFVPCLESGIYTKLADESERVRILNNMEKWSINVTFQEDGTIKIK